MYLLEEANDLKYKAEQYIKPLVAILLRTLTLKTRKFIQLQYTWTW